MKQIYRKSKKFSQKRNQSSNLKVTFADDFCRMVILQTGQRVGRTFLDSCIRAFEFTKYSKSLFRSKHFANSYSFWKTIFKRVLNAWQFHKIRNFFWWPLKGNYSMIKFALECDYFFITITIVIQLIEFIFSLLHFWSPVETNHRRFSFVNARENIWIIFNFSEWNAISRYQSNICKAFDCEILKIYFSVSDWSTPEKILCRCWDWAIF